MQKNYLYILTLSLCCAVFIHAQDQNSVQKKQETEQQIMVAPSQEENMDSFEDLFSLDPVEDGLEMHEHLEEDLELAALEPYASKPNTPSHFSVFMRKVGLKLLIGYLAFSTYFEQAWANVKGSATRLGQWLSGSYVNQA